MTRGTNLSNARCDLRHTRSDALSYCARRDLLLAGRAASSVAQYVAYIAGFDGWLDRQLVAVNSPRDPSRELIEAFLLQLRSRA